MTAPSLYDQLADLPLTIERYGTEYRERNCAGDFARISVLLALQKANPGQRGFVLLY